MEKGKSVSENKQVKRISIFNRNYSRKCHIVARVQSHLNNSGALDIHLLTGSGVSPSNPAGLVEAMRFHSAGVIAHEHLQHHRLVVTFQLKHSSTDRIVQLTSNVLIKTGSISCS